MSKKEKKFVPEYVSEETWHSMVEELRPIINSAGLNVDISYSDDDQYVIQPRDSVIDYKYNEGKALQEIAEYVNGTYGEHYSQNKFQATEFIIDSGHGEGFCLGNMLKYTQRYGKKNAPAEWRKDLMKVIHYSIIMLHVHDLQHKKDI